MTYDAVIVGASIAGLYTGYRLAASGWHVCILDRRSEIGTPVRCGEATGNRAEIERFVEIDESWIASDLKGLAVHVGTQTAMSREIPDTGVVLHRDLFEQNLAKLAQSHGADVRLGASVVGLCGQAPAWTGVALADGEQIDGRVIAGADGGECSIGRWAGICRELSLGDSYSAVQYRVKSDFCNDGLMHFFVGQSVVPAGYIWVFPKGGGEVSVGAGLYGGRRGGKVALDWLDQFMDEHFAGTPRSHMITGCAPLAVSPKYLHKGNVVLVGDAARQVNPLTAGGIMNALESADTLTTELTSSGTHSRAFKRYSRAWRRKGRREQKVFVLLRQVYLECPDEALGKLLVRADRAMGALTDRSKPFRWPVIELTRILVMLFPRAWRHLGILLR